jgi:hypothetical protein
MTIFWLAAGLMTVALVVAGLQRPRPAVIVAAIVWLLYAVYEYFVATGVLCDADCNIRVDLVLFFPVLGIVTFYAYRAYVGRPAPLKIVGIVLGVLALFVLGLMLEPFIGVFAMLGVLAALAIGFYLMRSRAKSEPS